MARTERGDRIAVRVERNRDGVLISVEDGRPGDAVVGPASAFLAELHGGWIRAGSLPNGTGVVRAFLPGGSVTPGADRSGSETAAAV